jgi:hypothetical protein
LSGTFYCRSELTAPWALALPAMEGCLMFHVVTSGRCWLEVEGAEHRVIQPGDLALVPHGQGHRLSSEPGVAAPVIQAIRSRIQEDPAAQSGWLGALAPRGFWRPRRSPKTH